MKNHPEYLMEDDREAARLDLKTDPAVVENQAVWAGIEPGMRVADCGCGPGQDNLSSEPAGAAGRADRRFRHRPAAD